MANRKRLLTGLQPSGSLHVGNYFGALKPFTNLYNSYDSHLMVVDYHALTTLRDKDQLQENIRSIVKDYIAAGVDPQQVILFKQSDVPQHTELAWIFECLVSVPFLMQAHAYKDKVAKGHEANAGLFNYPMLMAADILLYDTEIVPVGEDQRQHIEYTREAANKFNNAYGETFTAPKEHILKEVGVIPGTDGKKMSKSYKNTIPLFGTDEDWEKAVMSIVTDSKGPEEPKNPEECTVFNLHELFSEADLSIIERRYREGGLGYKESKEMLLANMRAYLSPMRERRESITDADVQEILSQGGEQARERAEAKMSVVRERIGVTL